MHEQLVLQRIGVRERSVHYVCWQHPDVWVNTLLQWAGLRLKPEQSQVPPTNLRRRPRDVRRALLLQWI